MDELRGLFDGDEGGFITEWAGPSFSPANDPPTAISAACDEKVVRSVRRGTARCLLLLAKHPNGLTDDEAVDLYRQEYELEWKYRGTVGLVRSVLRNWCTLKPNDDTRNHLQKNLCLIHRTGEERINPYSGRKNVVFNFINSPTDIQLLDWCRIASGEDEKEVGDV